NCVVDILRKILGNISYHFCTFPFYPWRIVVQCFRYKYQKSFVCNGGTLFVAYSRASMQVALSVCLCFSANAIKSSKVNLLVLNPSPSCVTLAFAFIVLSWIICSSFLVGMD